jgi:NAD(P)-dependent dehydrogenase (short-subunit alcohol dehydrogenase family)
MGEEEKEKRVERFLLCLGRLTVISNVCIYLLSDASRWVTGLNIIVDGRIYRKVKL